jgi:oligopeptide/dipeptide ABC transporter ATP-binding protein
MHISRMPLLEVEDLRVHIRREGSVAAAVDGVAFALAAGETLALVGESGCGKSLTALGIIGLLPPAAAYAGGRLRFEGRDLLTLPERERRALRGTAMAMVFQDPMSYLNPVLRCGDQVAEALRVHGVSAQEAHKRVLELFGETGLPDPERQARQYPHELSGGMRQRVLISMALAMKPRLLIADEPTTALDATVQAQILELLRRLSRERNMALLLISHDLGAVSRIADRVAVMYAGKVAEHLPVARLFKDPRHPYTKALIDSIPARIPEGMPLRGIPGQVPDPRNYPTGCRFHPRCSRRLERCMHEDPPLVHGYACHNPWPGEDS